MKTIKGSTLILTVVAIAIALASFNVWYQRSLTHQTQTLWGNEVSLLIATAPRAELLRLGPAVQAPAEDADTVSIGGVSIDGVSWRIIELRVMADEGQQKISPGFLNVRHSLRQDASYVWDEPGKSTTPQWRYALRFSDRSAGKNAGGNAESEPSVAILFFSADGRIARSDGKAQGQLIPRIADGLVKFVEEKFAEEKNDTVLGFR